MSVATAPAADELPMRGGPGRTGYVIGVVLVVLGLATLVPASLGISHFASRVGFNEYLTPGTEGSYHLKTGTYLLRYDSDLRSVDAARPDIQVELPGSDSRRATVQPLTDTVRRTDDYGQRCVCYDFAAIRVHHDGTYRVRLGSVPDRDGDVRMRRDVQWDDAQWLVGGIGSAALGGLLGLSGVILLVVTGIRRSMARRPPRPAAAWQAPPQAWYPPPQQGWYPPPTGWGPPGWGPPPAPGWSGPPPSAPLPQGAQAAPPGENPDSGSVTSQGDGPPS